MCFIFFEVVAVGATGVLIQSSDFVNLEIVSGMLQLFADIVPNKSAQTPGLFEFFGEQDELPLKIIFVSGF